MAILLMQNKNIVKHFYSKRIVIKVGNRPVNMHIQSAFQQGVKFLVLNKWMLFLVKQWYSFPLCGNSESEAVLMCLW